MKNQFANKSSFRAAVLPVAMVLLACVGRFANAAEPLGRYSHRSNCSGWT